MGEGMWFGNICTLTGNYAMPEKDKTKISIKIMNTRLVRSTRRVSRRMRMIFGNYVSFAKFLLALRKKKLANPASVFKGHVTRFMANKAYVNRYFGSDYAVEMFKHLRRMSTAPALVNGGDVKDILTDSQFKVSARKFMGVFSEGIQRILETKFKEKVAKFDYKTRTLRVVGIPVVCFYQMTAKEIKEKELEEKFPEETKRLRQLKERKKRTIQKAADENGHVTSSSRVLGAIITVGMRPEDKAAMNEELREPNKKLRKKRAQLREMRKTAKRLTAAHKRAESKGATPQELEAINDEIISVVGAMRGKFDGKWSDQEGHSGTWLAIQQSGYTPIHASENVVMKFARATMAKVTGNWLFRVQGRGRLRQTLKLSIDERGNVRTRGGGPDVSGSNFHIKRGWLGGHLQIGDRIVNLTAARKEKSGLAEEVDEAKGVVANIRDKYDQTVYNDDGTSVPLETFVKQRRRQLDDERFKKNVVRVERYVESLDRVDEGKIDKLVGEGSQVRWRALTDSRVSQEHTLTKMFPVVEVDGEEIVASGRFKGIRMEELINKADRLIKGTCHVIDDDGNVRSVEVERDNGEVDYLVKYEPYLTVTSHGQLLMVIPRAKEIVDMAEVTKSLGRGRRKKQIKYTPAFELMIEIAKISKTCYPIGGVGSENEKRLPTTMASSTWIVAPKDVDYAKDKLGSISMSSEAAKIMAEFYKRRRETNQVQIEEEYADITPESIPGFKKTWVDSDGNEHPMKFLSYQKKAIAYIQKKGGSLVGLDTGLGKSLVSIASLLAWLGDGTLNEDGRNGRALYVVPASLRGNIPAEIRKFCENPKEVLEYVDIVSYDEYMKMDPKDVERYGAVFMDEAQALKNPLGRKASKKARRALELNHPRKVLLTASVMEKALTLDSKILTPNGWVLMGDIEVGQDVITPKGTIAKVTAVHPHDERDVYEVVFNDGASVRCGEGHLWATSTYKERNEGECVWNSDAGEYKALPVLDRIASRKFVPRTTKEIRDSLVKKCGQSDHMNHQIPMVGRLDFDSVGLNIHPYLLGVLIGDGHISNGEVSFVSHEEDGFVSEKIEGLGALRDLRYSTSRKGETICYRISAEQSNTKSTWMKNVLEMLGLYGLTSKDKFVPKKYLFSSYDDRLELLRGLMDTDGYIGENSSTPLFCTISERLADDVKFLVESLGGTVTITTRNPKYKDDSGNVVDGKKAYHVYIHLMKNVFSLPRKANRWIPHRSKLPLRYIKEVNLVGREEIRCISIDDPDGLFVTDHFVVTHNSPEELYSLVMIANNEFSMDPETAKKRRSEFLRDTCEVVRGRAVAMRSDEISMRTMSEWVKANCLYVDKRQVAEEIELPPVTPNDQQTEALEFTDEAEAKYIRVSKGIRDTLLRMKQMYTEGRLTVGEMRKKLMTGEVMRGIIELRQISNDVELFERKKLRRKLAKRYYGKMLVKGDRLTKEEAARIEAEVNETVPHIPNPKIERSKELVAAKAASGKRTCLWTDQPSFALKTAVELAADFPGKLTAVCLTDRIVVFESSGAIAAQKGAKYKRICMPGGLQGKSCSVEMDFGPSSKYIFPNGESVEKAQWQKFIMDYVLAPNADIVAVVLTSSYSKGHNIQWCSSVIHLDRDNWNNEEMKQRTARCWRQGQPEPVDVAILDSVLPYSERGKGSRISINEIQKWMQEMEDEMFDKVVRQSMGEVDELGTVEFTETAKMLMDRKLLDFALFPTSETEADAPNVSLDTK
jgi:hypothetical protein